jgi:hypothetical protein
MMAEDTVAVDQDLCDLCPRQRPEEPRAKGVGWIDNFWVCADCFKTYCRKLEAAGRRSRGRT